MGFEGCIWVGNGTSSMSDEIVCLVPISGQDPEFQGEQLPTLGNRDLLSYTLKAALDAQRIDRVVVSTDSERIAAACRKQGADVPFLRPVSLATPATSLVSVLCHALEWLAEHEDYRPDWVLLMTITYPFRRAGFIDAFLSSVLQSHVNSAFTAVIERNAHWYSDEDGRPRLVSFGSDIARAHKPPLYKEMSGLALLTRREIVLSGTLYGDELGIVPVSDAWATINIHDEIGKQLARLLAPHFQSSEDLIR